MLGAVRFYSIKYVPGVVGCACGCLAWIAGGLLAAGGVERADLPSPRLWSWLLLDAALGPLLIESLWLW